MTEPVQTSVAATVLWRVIKPVVYLVQVFTDQPKIAVLFPRSKRASKNTAWVYEENPDQAPGVGLFYFGVTTSAAEEVEVIEVSILFDTPLHLKNPTTDTSFEPFSSPDQTHPFGLRWTGQAIVTKSLMQTFGVEARFEQGIKARSIILVLKARRRVTEIGGFEAQRRVKRISRTVRLELTTDAPQGFVYPTDLPSFTSPQPFMRQGGCGFPGDPVLARVNCVDQNGRPVSRMHQSPGSTKGL